MRKFILAIVALGFVSCQSNDPTDDYIDDDVIDNSRLFTLSFQAGTNEEGSDAVSTADTRVAASLASNVVFYWSTLEEHTCVDMLDNYYGQTNTDGTVTPSEKYYYMSGGTSSTASTISLEVDLPIYGLNTSVDGSTATVSVYSLYPSIRMNDKYPNLFTVLTPETETTATWNDDQLLMEIPSAQDFEINADEDVSSSYEVYGKYLPFISIPLKDYTVIWDKDTQEASFEWPGTLTYIPAFHSILLRIYPDLTNPDLLAIKAHSYEAIVTLQNTEFRTIEKLNMKNFSNGGGLNDVAITDARMTLSSSNRGLVSSVKSTITYVDSNGNGVDITPTSRVSSGNTYMVLPIFAPRTEDEVDSFTVDIVFRDLDGNIVMEIDRYWYEPNPNAYIYAWKYGGYTIINLDEDCFNPYYVPGSEYEGVGSPDDYKSTIL